MSTYAPILSTLGCFLILCAWLGYELRKSRRKMQKTTTDFWEREQKANLTRRVSPDTLPYLSIPLEQFPIGRHPDHELQEAEMRLQQLSGEKILNLTGKTSTELKETYGLANLPLLNECDTNFTELVRLLYQYGERLVSLGYEQDAIPVLEFGIAILTDISGNYKLLATLYQKQNHPEKIQSLKETAHKLDSLMKPKILRELDEISRS